MAQNIVIPNKDNKVVLTFGGIDLTVATDLSVVFGAETYTLLLNPTVVVVNSATELSLDLSGTSEVGRVFITVTYIDGASVNGTDITSQELGNLGQIIVAVGSQLVIEDGTVVANANSYASDAEMKAHANLRDLTVPATQPERESLLIIAMDYLASQEAKMQGSRTDTTQLLSYPRTGVDIYGASLGYNSIPIQLKNAQIEAAIAANSQSLLVNTSSKNIASEKVDVLEVSYFSGGAWESVRLDTVDAQLKPLLKNGGSNRLIRI